MTTELNLAILLCFKSQVKRLLSRFDISGVRNERDLEDLIDKTKVRIDKAKAAIARKNDPQPGPDAPIMSSSSASGNGEPEVKRKREEMGRDERKEFDLWLESVKKKRCVSK